MENIKTVWPPEGRIMACAKICQFEENRASFNSHEDELSIYLPHLYGGEDKEAA